ncbi:MAG TPA: hypothetical protein VHT24_11060, partial [Pseudacidobacterium sp.]|nr:hypothetical protein [Pseudacidobacterium sp.]
MQPQVSTSETTGTISLLLEMRLPGGAWENNEMTSSPWANLRGVHWKATYIAGLILLLAITTWLTPPRAIELHNILHHLNFLPFMIAGMIFG